MSNQNFPVLLHLLGELYRQFLRQRGECERHRLLYRNKLFCLRECCRKPKDLLNQDLYGGTKNINVFNLQ